MSKSGMAGGLSNRNFRLSLSYLPDPPTTYTVDFSSLDGGLNVYDLDYQLPTNESPDIKNLHWRDGALGSREGQKWFLKNSVSGETGYAAYGTTFWDYCFVHVADEIRCFCPTDEEPFYTVLHTGVPNNRGTFLRYGEYLIYKNRGGYYRIRYVSGKSAAADTFICEAIGEGEFTIWTPTTYINMNPSTHAGDSYQPENRLCYDKTVWYTPATADGSKNFAGDGSTKVFTLDYNSSTRAGLLAIGLVYIGTTLKYEGTDYKKDLSTGTVTFTTAPASDTTVIVHYTTCLPDYYLPVQQGSDETLTIQKITVNGTEMSADTDYSFSAEKGLVSFVHSPMQESPLVANTVKITYRYVNTSAVNAYNAVMSCRYGIVYGGDQNLCVVFGGCEAQPNAYFWNGNNVAMDAGYFPMEQYNLAGDTEDRITGFGKQQSYMIVFKERSIGRVEMSTTTVSSDEDARAYITMNYTPINSRIGCSFPRSIQLVENNLVFVSTEYGVCYLQDSTWAEEMNVLSISKKIEGSDSSRSGFITTKKYLKYDLEHVDHVSSVFYNKCYWLNANGHVYLWDSELSTYKDPSWFYYTNISAVDYIHTGDKLYHLNSEGSITRFDDGMFYDYEYSDDDDSVGAIEKCYQFATQHMGTYARLKDVRTVLIATRSDTDATTRIRYDTDYEKRYDLTPIAQHNYKLAPRDLSRRQLAVYKYAYVSRRDPMCRHVRHFSLRLENDTAREDLSVISAQIQYTLQGRER